MEKLKEAGDKVLMQGNVLHTLPLWLCKVHSFNAISDHPTHKCQGGSRFLK